MSTNNPQAIAPSAQDPFTHYPAQRITTTCDNLDFANCWEADILRNVASYLDSAHKGNPWSLSAFRSGFTIGWARLREYPLMVDVRFIGSRSPEAQWEESTMSEDSALDIVNNVAGIISDQWQGEIVHVDVCKTQLHSRNVRVDVTDTDLRSAQLPENMNSPNQDPRILPIPAGCVSRSPPFPGASIGQWKNRDILGALGTLTGYIRHRDDHHYYCLTASHVLPQGLGSLAESPDLLQQKDLIGRVYRKYSGLSSRGTFNKIRDSIASLASLISSNPDPSGVRFWRQILKDIESWNPVLGPVVSTSTTAKVGDFDWALIQLTPDRCKNVRQLNRVSISSPSHSIASLPISSSTHPSINTTVAPVSN